MRCWVTLLPFSATGTWIDYVYGFVSLDPAPSAVEEGVVEDVPGLAAESAPEPAGSVAELLEVATELVNAAAEQNEEVPPVVEEAVEPEPIEEAVEPEPVEEAAEIEPQPPEQDALAYDEHEDEEAAPPAKATKAGFSAKLLEGLASVGFYGKNIQVEPDLPAIPVAEEASEPVAIEESVKPEARDEAFVGEEEQPIESVAPAEPVEMIEPVTPNEPVVSKKPVSTPEGSMQSKLDQVRSKADEARQAKLRANVALYEGLSAAYDFALDAEDNAEEYLKLVETQGLKIQLRSPMKPVVKLAFDGMCDEATIAQLEAVLAWALKADLPRGSLAEQFEAAGGIGPILNGQARAA